MAPPWSCFGKQCHFGGWSQNSARGGAELRTIKWLQGWSRVCSTFFLSNGIKASHRYHYGHLWVKNDLTFGG